MALGMASGQTINVNQVRPSATNGQVVTTVGGNTVWATPSNNFLSPFVPPISGQYTLVFPTSYSFTTGSTGPCTSGPAEPTGSVTGSDSSASITNGPCGNTISNNSWGITWSGFALPSYVTAANVSAIYSEAVSSASNGSGGVIFNFTCTDNTNTLIPSGGGSSWGLQVVSSPSTATGSTIGSISCSAQSTRSIDIAPAEARFNIPSIALLVYYTGAAPPQNPGTTVMPPLYYNPALQQLGVDFAYPPNLVGVTIANLPAAVNADGQLWLVTNGASSSDCSTGGGSNPVLCYSNGSTWTAYGGGGGGMVYPAANTLGLSNGSGTGWTTPSAATIVALFGGGSCSGFLKSDGSCVSLTTMTYPAGSTLGFTNTGGTAWQTPTYAAIVALFSGCGSGAPYLEYNGNCGSGGGGGSVSVNGSAVSSPNFNSTTPAAPSGYENCDWQVSGSNISCYLLIGGGQSPLYGIGGFGNDAIGTVVANYSQNTTFSAGGFTWQSDNAHLVTTQAGHTYRVVWYFTGYSTGANLALFEAGTSGGSAGGYFFGDSNMYYITGGSFTSIGTATAVAAVNDANPQFAETYIYVEAANLNRIWGKAFGGEWFGFTDNHADFTSNQLQLGFFANGSQNPTAVQVYDLGTVPTTPPGGSGGGSMVYPGAGIPVSTGSAWGTSLTKIGTDSGSPTAGTLSGQGNPACVDANGGISTQSCYTPVAIFVPGTMTNAQVLWYSQYTVAYTVPASCAGSYLHAKVAATASTVITITDATTSTTLCTATFAASGNSATWSGSGGTISAGDIVEIDGPSTADVTLATVGGQIRVIR
jgi:hypothetical protein